MANCPDKANGGRLDSMSEQYEGGRGIEQTVLPRRILSKGKPVRTSMKNTCKKRGEQNRRIQTGRVHLVDYRPEMKREEPFEFNRNLLQKLTPSSVKVTQGEKSKQIGKLQSNSVSEGDMTEEIYEKAEVTTLDCVNFGMNNSGNNCESNNASTLQPPEKRLMETRNPKQDMKGNISSIPCKITKATLVGNGHSYKVGKKMSKSSGSFRQGFAKHTEEKGFVGKVDQFKRSSNLQKKKKQNSGRHSYKIRHKIVACKIKPRNIRFTKTRISTKFAGINKTVNDTLQELKAGLITVEDIPKIIVFRSRGKNYTINNKRLLVFKQLSTYYRKCFGIDIVIPVLFHESLKRLKVSRTFGCNPRNITEKSIAEKSKSAQSSKKLYVRSKKGRKQKCAPGEKFRMKKADIRRCRNGDDDFELFSEAKREFDYLSSDSEDTEYMSPSDRGESNKRFPDIGSLKVFSGLSAEGRKNRVKSYGFSSSRRFPGLNGYIEEFLEGKMRQWEEEMVKDYEISREPSRRSNYNQQYSKKNNVKIVGVKQNNNETPQSLTKSVIEILKSQDINLQEIDIESIHRIRTTKRHSKRPVILKLKNDNCKSAIMSKRAVMENAGHRLVDDVTRLNQELISRLYRHPQIKSAWHSKGEVFGKSCFNERIRFDIYDNITSVISEHRLKHGDPENA